MLIGLLESVLTKIAFSIYDKLADDIYSISPTVYGLITPKLIHIKRQLNELLSTPIYAAISHFESAIIHLSCKKPDDYKKYFNYVIEEATRALSTTSISIENRILMVEIMSIAQLFTENRSGAITIIRKNLRALSENKEIINIYRNLAFFGCSVDSYEIQIAKKLCVLHNVLRPICSSVSSKEFNFELEHDFMPTGKEGFGYKHKISSDPINPHIRIMSKSEKGLRATGTAILIPVYFGISAGFSLLSTLFAPFYYTSLLFDVAKAKLTSDAREQSYLMQEAERKAEEYLSQNMGMVYAAPSLVASKFMDYYECGIPNVMQYDKGEITIIS